MWKKVSNTFVPVKIYELLSIWGSTKSMRPFLCHHRSNARPPAASGLDVLVKKPRESLSKVNSTLLASAVRSPFPQEPPPQNRSRLQDVGCVQSTRNKRPGQSTQTSTELEDQFTQPITEFKDQST